MGYVREAVGGRINSECVGDDEGDRFGFDFFDASTDRLGEDFRGVGGTVCPFVDGGFQLGEWFEIVSDRDGSSDPVR